MANVSPEVVFRISFLTLIGADVHFLDWKLWWRIYTIKKALPTIKRIELICKKEFAAAKLNSEHETYVVHIGSVSSVTLFSFFPIDIKEFVTAILNLEYKTYTVYVKSISFIASLSSSPLNVHPFNRPQIAGLIAKEAPTKIPIEYTNFVFSPNLASKRSKYTGINDYTIELAMPTGLSNYLNHLQVLSSFWIRS